MTNRDILEILKTDLEISVNSRDDYLTKLIEAAREEISREGIRLTDTTGDGMLVENYAAYLYRKRKENVASMPRFLRIAMNRRLFGGKG